MEAQGKKPILPWQTIIKGIKGTILRVSASRIPVLKSGKCPIFLAFPSKNSLSSILWVCHFSEKNDKSEEILKTRNCYFPYVKINAQGLILFLKLSFLKDRSSNDAGFSNELILNSFSILRTPSGRKLHCHLVTCSDFINTGCPWSLQVFFGIPCIVLMDWKLQNVYSTVT